MQKDLVGLVRTSFGLVALYLVVRNFGGAVAVFKAGGTVWANVIKALQGR